MNVQQLFQQDVINLSLLYLNLMNYFDGLLQWRHSKLSHNKHLSLPELTWPSKHPFALMCDLKS